jgi:hypothetical protein
MRLFPWTCFGIQGMKPKLQAETKVAGNRSVVARLEAKDTE